MNNLCGNCKHWGKPSEGVFEFRSCIAVVYDADNKAAEYEGQYGPDEDEGKMADVAKFRKEHLAVTTDGSGFRASLHTREDFGCVLWEAKTD